MIKETILSNAHIVTSTDDFYGSLVIEKGIITNIIKDRFYKHSIDLQGAWLIPGIIDIHSDYLEKEFFPRPNTGFPNELAMRHLDYRAATSGITTLFNGVSFRENESQSRDVAKAIKTCQKMEEFKKHKYFMINHYIHARLDTTCEELLNHIDEILSFESLKLAVYNDHTPGQRQFRNLDFYADWVTSGGKLSRDEVLQSVSVIQKEASEKDYVQGDLYHRLKNMPIRLGSHDDTTEEHIDLAIEHGASISEFPTTMEAARYAKKKNLMVVMGAPNLILGYSQSGNISCQQAIEENLVDILCSDYHLPAMLSASWKLVKNGWSPHQAINLISLNPAKAIGLNKQIGSIKIGKKADLTVFSLLFNEPVVEKIIIHGEIKLMTNFSQRHL